MKTNPPTKIHKFQGQVVEKKGRKTDGLILNITSLRVLTIEKFYVLFGLDIICFQLNFSFLDDLLCTQGYKYS